MNRHYPNQKGQIWIETVLYTLIGLALIGVVLAVATPRISEARERLTIEQGIDAMNELDLRVRAVLEDGPGNIRIAEDFLLRRGQLSINAPENTIELVFSDLTSPYSEPGVVINQGSVSVLTWADRDEYTVSLTLSYGAGVDLRSRDNNNLVRYTAAPTPYTFRIENGGLVSDVSSDPGTNITFREQ